MSNSDIYDIPLLPANSSSPEVPLNDAQNKSEKAVNSVKSYTVTGTTDPAPTKANMAEGYVQSLGGTPSGDFNFSVPAVARVFLVRNVTGKIATVQVTGGAGKKVIITDGNEVELRSDGTDIFVNTPWAVAAKTADTTRSTTTTVTDDPHLKFRMEASTTYRIRGIIFFDTGATADFKFSLSGPASPTLVRIMRIQDAAGAAPTTVAVDTSYPANISLTGSGTDGGFVEFEALVQNGSTAGNFAFGWAQDTSDAANTIVRKGSYLEYQRC